jgi:two-component system, OmpR family, response regulator
LPRATAAALRALTAVNSQPGAWPTLQATPPTDRNVSAQASPATESSTRRLLVIDDDPEGLEQLTVYLSEQGFEVRSALTVADAEQALERSRFDLVVLELHRAGEDGLDFIRWLQANHECALVVLSDHAEPADRILALELGADDLLCRPFDSRELLARMRAVLRRLGVAQRLHGEGEPLAFDRYRLERRARRLVDSDGVEIALSDDEYPLLCALVEAAQCTLSREELVNRSQIRPGRSARRRVDTGIGSLRRKLEPDASHPRLIRSIGSGGYMLDAPARPMPSR